MRAGVGNVGGMAATAEKREGRAESEDGKANGNAFHDCVRHVPMVFR
jgi:hypothetical protein